MYSRTQLEKLEQTAGSSPFYCVDRRRFERNFDDLTTAFQTRYPAFQLAYSYKTNYIPYLCGIIRQKGGWAEVVSRLEYDLAIRVGQDPRRIIFNGPLKTSQDTRLALDNGSIVNLDCLPQFEAARAYAQEHSKQTVCAGLRINIGLCDAAGQSHIQNGLHVGRFGFDPAEVNVATAGDRIKIVSLHGHASTTDRSVWGFERIAKTLCDIAEQAFPDTVEYINVGGGFYGRMHPQMPFKNAPSFDDYAEAICRVLKTHRWASRKKPILVIEPGVALVADAVSFVTRVISVKQVANQLFVTVDGSAFHVKPTFHSLNLPHQIITAANSGEQTYTVVGSTCMEKDILLRDITAPLPCPGDCIRIENVGAYTLVMTPPFIHPAPAIVADEGSDTFRLIRRRQTFDDIFGNYIF